MKIKIRPRLDAKLVVGARAFGLDLSRIVEEALIREIARARIRHPVRRTGDQEGDGVPE